MIELSGLKVEKQGQTICQVEQLQVDPGDRLGVVGANGSGKTTLLRVLAGLEIGFSGKCNVAAGRLQKTYLHQQPLLFRGTALSNVRYAHRSADASTAWLERLGVAHLADRDAQSLSGGEARRVALARTLATGAKLLLLDEPLADLDPEATELVCNLLSQLTDRTMIIASPIPLPDALQTDVFNM